MKVVRMQATYRIRWNNGTRGERTTNRCGDQIERRQPVVHQLAQHRPSWVSAVEEGKSAGARAGVPVKLEAVGAVVRNAGGQREYQKQRALNRFETT